MRTLFAAVAVAALFAAPGAGRAQVGERSPSSVGRGELPLERRQGRALETSFDFGTSKVVAAAAAARSAPAPAVYAALRELWGLWDRTDPSLVEETLAAVAEDATRTPATRVYAEVMRAYARRRRGDLDGAEAALGRLGFVRHWLVVGPFDNEGKAGLDTVHGPEQELDEPLVAGRAYDGKQRPVRWRTTPDVFRYGWVDFGDLVRPKEHGCSFATAYLNGVEGRPLPPKLGLWVGVGGAFKLYWNGSEVLKDAAYRDFDVDRSAVVVQTTPGDNRMVLKVCGNADAPSFALRVAKPDGSPELGVEVRAEPSPAPKRPSASRSRPSSTPPAIGPLGQLPLRHRGPSFRSALRPVAVRSTPGNGAIQLFERSVARTGASAADLEAYARYLSLTGGDPEGEHRARELARRAAEREPTVARLLLAGELAEDRNQRAAWVDRAEAAAARADATSSAERKVHATCDVLLARARLARSGTNWREAIPLYDRVLALDPFEIEAIVGRAESLVAIGLKRTAMAELEQAVARMPRSVALLRVYASQLRNEGFGNEAADAEARYAAFRFDDTTLLASFVDLAVARHQNVAAERWLQRLLRTEPSSAWAHAFAARTYRALGDPARATTALRQALVLAPEDVATLKSLADLEGELGRGSEQQTLLRQVLALMPQATDVREYLEHVGPVRPREDEAHAWEADRLLLLAKAPAGTFRRRTLRDLNVTTVFANGLSSRFRQVVFQPLTVEAAAQARDYVFGYEADRQVVQLRLAKVHRAAGGADEAIESGEGPANDPSVGMYTSARTFYVRFPKLEPGDVVELRYRVEDVTLRNEFADHFGEINYLQSAEPIASAEYVLIAPKNRSLTLHATPLAGLVRESKALGTDRVMHRFVARDVAPIVGEPSMPPWSEVAAHVHVSTYRDWAEVGAWYWGLARDQMDVDDEVRRRVRELTRGLTDDRSKVRAIYRYVTSETRYVALEFGIDGFRPRRSALTLARGWGDCKDKAALIVSMLREVGIPARLVVVRTAMRGNIEQQPASLAPFDHAIAYVPSLDLYLDGTAENTGSTELPAMDRGAIGLVIDEGKTRLVRLPEPGATESQRKRKLDLTLAQDGTATLELRAETSGGLAPEWRRRYQDENSRRQRLAEDLSSELGPVELAAGKHGLAIDDIDVERPVRLTARGKAILGRREGDAWSIPVGPQEHMVSQLAPLASRKLDVKLSLLTSMQDEWTLRLPGSMRVLSAVVPVDVRTPFGTVTVSAEQSPGKLVVRSSLTVTKSRISPAEYPEFRAFCEQVDRALSQRVRVGQ